MSELKTPRLLAAAKEFNIGQDTLVEFLVKKGFSRDELKPTAKLSSDQYYALQAEFQGDKVAKNKADQVEIPKVAAQAEPKKKRDEEDLSFAKKEDKKVRKEEPVVEAPVAAAPAPEVKAPVAEKTVAPEIEAPKVINKIDLSAIDSSTRPKKAAKKKVEDAPAEQVQKPAAKTTKKKAAEETPVVPVVTAAAPAPTVEEDVAPTIENIRADKLEGPKILGKIDLPINSDTRPKPAARDEKRKRKRIPVDGKPAPAAPTLGADGKPVSGPNRPIVAANNRNNQGGGGGQFNRGGGPGGNRGGNRNDRGKRAPIEDKEIDQKAIQEKIRETQAKLAGSGGKGKSLKAKYRRAKRDEAAEAMGEMTEDNKLQVTEFVTVSELANLMDVSFADVIGKCMNLGIMVSINQRLDAEVIELVSSEFGFEVEFIGIDDADEFDEEEDEDDEASLVERAPIVTIMGHVDHGKTSLLDYIRKANVIAGEAGGITQHIGAYEVTLPNNKHITFLDTPGHEAFTAMRARGAKVTDIVVIVIAADDKVMPQTKEAISHAQAAGVPMIFAINKIDRPEANAEKIREQLSAMNILVESWGGKYQDQEISAKKGLNVELLLEKILLEAEILELKADPDKRAVGTIIEASLDKGRGVVATVLIESGTLQTGDPILAGAHYGRVKVLQNERGQKVAKVGPAQPVQILGFATAPTAGERFYVAESESAAREISNKRQQLMREQGMRTRKHITLDEIGRRLAIGNFKELNLIVKGDVDGSVEALSDSLLQLSTKQIQVNVVHKGVGQITESDIMLASASDAIIVGFQVRPLASVRRLAEQEEIDIRTYSIIYDAIDEIKSAMEGMLAPTVEEKVVANVEIREVFKITKVGTVAGCMVLDGKINRNTKVRVLRDGVVIYTGELASLKRFKEDVKEVATGYECGLNIQNFNDIKVGDLIEGYERIEVKAKL